VILRACLAGLLAGTGSGSSGGSLPNIVPEEPFYSENREAGAVLEEPQIVASPKWLRLLRKSPLKEALPNTPLVYSTDHPVLTSSSSFFEWLDSHH